MKPYVVEYYTKQGSRESNTACTRRYHTEMCNSYASYT